MPLEPFTSPRSVDGFAPRLESSYPPAPQAAQARAPTQSNVHHRRTFAAPPEMRQRRRWWHKLLFPLCLVLCLCAGFLVQSLALGMTGIGLYAVVAWVRRLPSRYSFVLAFLSLVTVVILLVVRQNVELASNFATYTFLLLVVGIVSATAESRGNSQLTRSKIRR